jgi:hypothetical protein
MFWICLKAKSPVSRPGRLQKEDRTVRRRRGGSSNQAKRREGSASPENFEKAQKHLDEELFQFRSVITEVFGYILEKAKESYDKGKDYTVNFAKIARGVVGAPALTLTREVIKYLLESPGLWLGFLFCIWLGNYVPLTSDDNVFDWFAGWVKKRGVGALNSVKPVRAMFRFFGLNLHVPTPELSKWEEIMWDFQNGLVGAKWGALGQVVLDLLNKLFYRIRTDR